MAGPSREAAHVQVVGQTEGEYVMYTWRSVGILLWEGAASLEGVRAMHRSFRAFGRTHGHYSLIHWLRSNVVGMPGGEARQEINRLAKDLESALVCTAVLDGRRGFVASAVKSLLAGLSLIPGVRLKTRVFDEPASVVRWLVPLHAAAGGESLDAAELLAVLKQLSPTPSA
jgi:hypothetical protein